VSSTEAETGPRRKRARPGEGERLREEILDATEELLFSEGEQHVSLRAVATAVGVTTPSIYLHFADKQNLLFAVCERHFALFDEVMQQAVEGVTDVVERLRARGRAYVYYALEQPEAYRILFMTPSVHTAERRDMATFLAEEMGFRHCFDDAERAVEQGVLEGDPFMITVLLWSGVHGIASLLITDRDFPWPADVDELIERTCNLLLAGVRGGAAA